MMRFRCVRYCSLSEVRDYWRNKAEVMHSRSEGGRGVWVALCAHLPHNDTDTLRKEAVRVAGDGSRSIVGFRFIGLEPSTN
jgi:hypothetical protein